MLVTLTGCNPTSVPDRLWRLHRDGVPWSCYFCGQTGKRCCFDLCSRVRLTASFDRRRSDGELSFATPSCSSPRVDSSLESSRPLACSASSRFHPMFIFTPPPRLAPRRDGRVELWESAGFLGIYALYVVVVVVSDKCCLKVSLSPLCFFSLLTPRPLIFFPSFSHLFLLFLNL